MVAPQEGLGAVRATRKVKKPGPLGVTSQRGVLNKEEGWSKKMVVPRDTVCPTPSADSALSVWVSDRKVTD